MKNREISDKIDGVFRFREEELRKLSPLWGDSTITQEQYVKLSGILSSVHSYFLAKTGADPDLAEYPDIDAITGLPKYKAEKKIRLTGQEALDSRKRAIKKVVGDYIILYGAIHQKVKDIFTMTVSPTQLDSTIRNLVFNSVGENTQIKNPQCVLVSVAKNDYNYEEILL